MLRKYGMTGQDKNALLRCSVTLCSELVVDEMLVQMLQADDILTESMAEAILAEKTSHKKSWHLLSLLPKRGPNAFSSFCTALKQTGQQHLCLLLTDGLKRKKEACDAGPVEAALVPQDCVESLLPLPTQEDGAKAKRARTNEHMEMSLDADSPVPMDVLPCSAQFYLLHCTQAYKMTTRPRGLALIISNVTFDPAVPELVGRVGGDVDEEVLMTLFNELDFTVMVFRDLTAQGMKQQIERFRMRREHRVMDSCVVCLLSHGVEGAVYGTDGQFVELDWVFKAFDNANCPQLQNKPKMFFIQACRGEEMDSGVDQLDGRERTQSPGCEAKDAGWERGNQGRDERERRGLRVKLPQRSDMICGFASLKGTAAMRNTKKGSWYIQELSKALRLRARNTHIADILVQVNGCIKQREGYAPGTQYHRCKEMSEYTSSLCKDLFLFPKHYPQQ